MEREIYGAIEKRLVIRFMYKGSLRSAEPFILGYNQKNHLALIAWQLSGGSTTDWRDFLLSKISGLSIGPDTFRPVRAGYSPSDSHMPRILCRV